MWLPIFVQLQGLLRPLRAPRELSRSLHHNPKVCSPLTPRELLPTHSTEDYLKAEEQSTVAALLWKYIHSTRVNPTMGNQAQMQSTQERLSSSDKLQVWCRNWWVKFYVLCYAGAQAR